MYDLGNTELIEKSDVSKMLDSVLSENPTMYIPEEELAYIMNQVRAYCFTRSRDALAQVSAGRRRAAR